VIGLILIDGPAYPTFRSKLRKIVQRSRQAGSPLALAGWLFQVAHRRMGVVWADLKSRLHSRGASPAEPQGRMPPPRHEYGAQLGKLADRGTRILCVFSGANDTGYNDPGQFFEWFPALRNRIQVEFFPRANHVFTEISARTALMDAVCTWCTDRSR
jgi:hypothetical protein